MSMWRLVEFVEGVVGGDREASQSVDGMGGWLGAPGCGAGIDV